MFKKLNLYYYIIIKSFAPLNKGMYCTKKFYILIIIRGFYKKGDKHSAENYRPVSLTSVPCKLLEHIICRNTMNHLEKHNILTSLNHGFRSGYSCETQLAVTIHDMLQSFNKMKQLNIAILDFSKAFDTVPHDRLLHKLNNYDIRGPLHA